jgi:twitching motility protein PilT
MAQLDRFLDVMVANHGESIDLIENDVAVLQVDGVSRPITRQALSSQQLLMLLREIAPDGAGDQLSEGTPTAFHYKHGDTTFSVRTTLNAGKWFASIGVYVPDLDPAANGDGAASSPEPRMATLIVEHDSQLAGASTDKERTAAALADMDKLLRILAEKGASDLHLRCGEPPLMRLHGEIVRLEGFPEIEDEGMTAMLRAIMPPRNRQEFADNWDTDFAYELEGVARFRANALKDRRGSAAVFRVIPSNVITVEQLGLSQEVQNLCYLSKGLVLVTGPTGSGKSTTLCALVDLVNRVRNDHVITIEDPIEFVHKNKKCMITQRQVGQHTQSFKAALRAALREDPDIILVGELRDLETVSIAIETAETGHLVFGTLHTTTAASTVDRIIDQFAADRQEQIRVMLSESLKGVIAQILCRKIGGGRVAAREILLAIPALSNLIREGKTFQIPSIIQTSRRMGMVTLNDALADLVDAHQVEPREAYLRAQDKTGLIMLLKNRGHDVSFADLEESTSGTKPGTPSAGKPSSPTSRPGIKK